MNRNNYWKELLHRHKDACFLANKQTKVIFYVNPVLEKIVGNAQDVIGKTYKDALASQHISVLSNEIPVWDMKENLSLEVYSKSMNFGFHCTFSVIPDTELICGILQSMDERVSEENAYEMALSRCVASSKKGESEKSLELLQLIGEYYEAERTYLYLVDRSSTKIIANYYWQKDEKSPVIKDLGQVVDVEKVLTWLESRNEAGIIDLDKGKSSYSEESYGKVLLDVFRLKNLVLAIVENTAGEPLGIVTVSDRKAMKADFRLLQTVAMFMEGDITKTETKYSAEQLNLHDILTGFHNRTAYSKRIEEITANPPQSLGVLLANVNGLKKVNTEYGYAKGDSFIKQSAQTLQKQFDTTFYRVAGDEFVAFFPNLSKEDFDRQVLAFQKELKESENYLFSLGHALGAGRFDCGQLISEADTMMYINKQEYYHNFKFVHQDIADSTLSDLLSYLEDDEFMIYLQPQVRLEDSSLYGAEALIRRFDKKNNKMVFPDQFISLYEQKSVIRHVDLFVLESVCKLMKTWLKTGLKLPISVNLSRVTLQEYGIVDSIVEICDRYEIPHELLVIEVTERVGLIENNVASSLILHFKKEGFHISLDDFGCAYSNIVTLAQIEVDEVKIDKSLVDDLTTNRKNHILVKNVLSMCHELDGASTLAEGIENKNQATLLYELGCHLGQGYYYSRPIPVDEFTKKYIKNMDKNTPSLQ